MAIAADEPASTSIDACFTLQELRELAREGMESGRSTRSMDEVIAEARARYSASSAFTGNE